MTRLPRPCIRCGEPSEGNYCTEHTPTKRVNDHILSARDRGYDSAWTRLSKRARRLQPWCSDCGTAKDLTTDHSPAAWQRHGAGLAIRLQDVAVVCRPCNSRRGAARKGIAAQTHSDAGVTRKPLTRGDAPPEGLRHPRWEGAKRVTHRY